MEKTHQYIAEIGTAHRGSITHAKELIHAAKESGAHFAKFQYVIADEIVSPHTGCIALPNGSTNIYEQFQDVMQNRDFYAELQEYCNTQDIGFLCSAFGMESLSHLISFSPKIIKIASPEINHTDMFAMIETHNKTHTDNPIGVMLSDGLACHLDMIRVFEHYPSTKKIILRCVTQYPSPPSKYQLQRMQIYQNMFQCPVGISDHTTHPFIMPVIATLLGSQYTEKHITLSNDTKGLDDSFALTPKKFATMIDAVEYVYTQIKSLTTQDYDMPFMVETMKKCMDIYGADEHIQNDRLEKMILDIIRGQGESAVFLPIYHTTRRSMFAAYDLEKGAVLTKKNTIVLRSETNLAHGIPAEYRDVFLGHMCKRNIQAKMPIRLEDISGAAC